jgi:hypothetical protein
MTGVTSIQQLTLRSSPTFICFSASEVRPANGRREMGSATVRAGDEAVVRLGLEAGMT